MIIQHSKRLLEHLSEIERDIRLIEDVLRSLGLEDEAERLLVAIMIRKRASSLAESKKN